MKRIQPTLTANRRLLTLLAREGYSPAEIAAAVRDEGQLGLDDLLAGYWRFVRWCEATDGREGWEERAEAVTERAALAARRELMNELEG